MQNLYQDLTNMFVEPIGLTIYIDMLDGTVASLLPFSTCEKDGIIKTVMGSTTRNDTEKVHKSKIPEDCIEFY